MPQDARRGLVVLPFRSLQDDTDDDLGRVMAEMAVTDLRSSPDLDVPSSGAVRRALLKLGLAADASDLPLRDVADALSRELVLTGSYVRTGERYRILIGLERPADGEILLSTQVESSTDGLFNAVDELTAAVRRVLDAKSVNPSGVASVSTGSLLAMRRYTRALELFYAGDLDAALPPLDSAVGADPEFALAWRLLGLVYERQGRLSDFQAAMDRAVALADRLPPKTRFLVRGDHFASRWDTLDQALQVYREAASLYPQDANFQSALGFALAQVELYEAAAEQYERTSRLQPERGYADLNLALVSTALGREARAESLVQAWAAQRPADWQRRMAVAWHNVTWNHLSRGSEVLDEARALVSTPQPELQDKLWSLHILQKDFAAAEDAARRLTRSEQDVGRWLGWVNLAKTYLFTGRSEQALDALKRAYEHEPWHHETELMRARLWLELGHAEQARSACRRVLERSDGDWTARRALFVSGLADLALERPDDAAQVLADLRRLARQNPGRRLAHRLAAHLARQRGDVDDAVRELEAAAALLPSRGIHFSVVEPDHVVVWSELGDRLSDAGRGDEATAAWHKAAAAGTERLHHPTAWRRAVEALEPRPGRDSKDRG